MTDWNFADHWEVVARTRPGAPAVVQGERTVSWEELDRAADGVAGALLEAGLGHGSKVAQYLYNRPEYLESFFGAAKAGMVPVNTNYRYTADELTYLFDNADVEAVVLEGSFLPVAAALRERVPRVRLWLVVGPPPEGGMPRWATPYGATNWAAAGGGINGAAAGGAGTRSVRGPWGRSGDDLVLLYTGGTTGLPKGVMWRQDDLWAVLNRSASLRFDEGGDLESVARRLGEPSRYPPPRLLAGPPLMHGTALFTALSALCSGGSVVLVEGRRFSATELLDAVSRHRVTEAAIVGDAFARPMLEALDAEPGRWDLSSLWLMVSSGVMWSAEVRSGLLAHNPGMTLVDTLGSSEAIGMARSRSGAGQAPTTAAFRLGESTKVITEDGADVAPGSGEQGLVAIKGRGPLGYYKDPAKSAATFRVIGGERWTVPGDYAVVDVDGTVRLLGRGSGCINTGGEKVFPEEVEEVLKRHPSVADAVVVGVPDPRFGEVVVAVVELAGADEPPAGELAGWVRSSLASFKAPRHVLVVPAIGRAPNGKVDYRRLKAEAARRVGAAPSAGV